MSVAENATPDTWNWGEHANDESASAIFDKYFAPYLKLLKNCGTNAGCFPNVIIANLNGKKNWRNLYSDSRYARAQLADGTFLVTYTLGNCINRSSIKSKPLNKTCGYFYIDIDGNKGPQKQGVDIFMFHITKYGIYPLGTQNDNTWSLPEHCDITSNIESSGAGCAAWILAKENMDYLDPAKASTIHW